VITYYQRTRHLFGKVQIEVLDDRGEVIDELQASNRRGLNRIVWSMHRPAPHVPPAAQLAEAGTEGPRVPPGTYTIRMQKGGKTYETRLDIGLDARVAWSLADRRAQYAAAMQVRDLFNDEYALYGQIAALRDALAAAAGARPATDPVAARLAAFDAQVDAVRREIVATREGGAITGEERLREHTDQLYGAIQSWDGPPSAYQLANAAALRQQLTAIGGEFSQLTTHELPALNGFLHGKGLPPIALPPPTAVDDDADRGGGAPASAHGADRDAEFSVDLPRRLRLWH
jgi:hypothetical protein